MSPAGPVRRAAADRRGALAIGEIVEVLGTLTSDHPAVARFVRGVAVGALVGAAIAGSAIWDRRHSPRAVGPGSANDRGGKRDGS